MAVTQNSPSPVTTRNLDTTVVLNHAKRIAQKTASFGKRLLRTTVHLLLT